MVFTERKYFCSAGSVLLLLSCMSESLVVPSSQREDVFQIFKAKESKATLICNSQSNNIYPFTIDADSPLGKINLLVVQHDGARKMPFATTALYNSLNHQKTYDRVDNFRQHDCDVLQDKQTNCSVTFKMTPEQAAFTGRTAFDRGHLTPVNPMMFSVSAIDNTFHCVNCAPQEPYTNQNPWFVVENFTHHQLNDTPGYVMTGVCDADSADGLTVDGWRVPACYWKLVCYRDSEQVTRVVGFIADNHIFHRNDEDAMLERDRESTRPRSQSAIFAVARSTVIQDGWRKAETYLLDNRFETEAPPSSECISAFRAPTSTLIEWGLE